MNTAPILTVITPARNASKYVAEYAKQFTNFERENGSTDASLVQVVVIDHASEDDTYEQLCAFAEASNLAEVHHAPDGLRSVDEVRMFGLTKSRGRYVWFCDIDDRFDFAGIFALAQRSMASGVDLTVFNADRVTEASGQLINHICDAPNGFNGATTDTFERVLMGQIQGHLWNKLFKRESFDGIDYYPRINLHGDLLLVLKVAARVTSRMDSPSTHYWYIQHPGSLFHSRTTARYDGLRAILEYVESERDKQPALTTAVGVFRVDTVLIPLANTVFQTETTNSVEAQWIRQQLAIPRPSNVNKVLTAKRKLQLAMLGRFGWPIYAKVYPEIRRRKWGT